MKPNARTICPRSINDGGQATSGHGDQSGSGDSHGGDGSNGSNGSNG
jgi:hypothetical protein